MFSSKPNLIIFFYCFDLIVFGILYLLAYLFQPTFIHVVMKFYVVYSSQLFLTVDLHSLMIDLFRITTCFLKKLIKNRCRGLISDQKRLKIIHPCFNNGVQERILKKNLREKEVSD